MDDQLLASTFLFRYAVPCLRRETLWTAKGTELGEEFRLPSLAELDGNRAYADVRTAWSDAGLAFSLRVEGKRQQAWCRENRLEDSDGFHVWLDTRDTHNIHRAGRFCHHFVFLPSGGGSRQEEAVAEPLLINRARENPRPVRPGMLKARSEKRVNGYLLEAFVPTAALTGFEPAEHPRLGFFYAVADRELGPQTFSIGREFPFEEDPSVWGTLELQKG
jgi:hypothetical protein